MKDKNLYILYGALNIVAYFLVFFDFSILFIIFRCISLLILCSIYFKYKKFNEYLFYLGIFFSAIGETYIVLGFNEYPREIIIPFIIYYLLVFALVNKTAGKSSFKVDTNNLLPLFISLFLIIYLVLNVLNVIVPQMGGNLYLAYVFVTIFLIVILYMGILCLTKHSYRYIWLLFLLMSFMIATIIVGFESYLYPSKFLKQIIYVAEISSHFFLLKFLTSEDKPLDLI